MTGFMNVDPAAAALSGVTEMVISGEMEASTAAGSAALIATKPMVLTSDDAAFTGTLAGELRIEFAQDFVAGALDVDVE